MNDLSISEVLEEITNGDTTSLIRTTIEDKLGKFTYKSTTQFKPVVFNL